MQAVDSGGEKVHGVRGDGQCRQMVYVGRGEGLCMEKRWLTPRERTVRMKKENNCQ